MIYLSLTEDNYLQGITFGPEPKPDEEGPLPPHIKDLTGIDISGIRMGAYKWDGEQLTFDNARYTALERREAAAEREAAKIVAKEEAVKEVQAALITEQINTLSVDDSTALRWKVLYPEWSPDSVLYYKDVKVQFDDKLFKCRQEHTSQANYSPDRTASLWTEINETHSGAVDDPIPYNGNMALENEKYYTQYDVKYKCTRDTINPIYNDLKDLVGLYVEVAT